MDVDRAKQMQEFADCGVGLKRGETAPRVTLRGEQKSSGGPKGLVTGRCIRPCMSC